MHYRTQTSRNWLPRIALIPSAIAIQAVFSGAWAADFTVLPSVTDNTAKSLAASSTGTVQDTGKLSVSGSTVAVTITGNNVSLTNLGQLLQTGTGRVIYDNTGVTGLVITNGSPTNSTALIKSSDADVIQMNKAGGSVTLYNYGTMSSLNPSAGGSQAVDFNAITAAGTNTVYNYATGIMQASQADAVRPGVNGLVYNAGTILSTSSTGSSSDGVDVQANTGIVVVNASSGTADHPMVPGPSLIEGARHGITGGPNTDISFTTSITNNVGGIIQGDNGSGVNLDGFSSKQTATIFNNGTITGNGHDFTGNTLSRDGDGIDVDGIVNIINTGIIRSINAFNIPGTGVAYSEGITVGGGTITNSGTIEGLIAAGNTNAVGRGITFAGNDITTGALGGTREAIYGNAIVTNQAGGLIRGDSGSAIAVEGPASINNYTVTINNNSGATIQGGGATNAAIWVRSDNVPTNPNITITNQGIIDGNSSGKAIALGLGINTVNNSGSITAAGSSDGGYGVNFTNAGSTLTNSGSILATTTSGSAYGVYLTAGGSTLTNKGSIVGTTSGVYNAGSVGSLTTFTNAQGGNAASAATTALTYRGALPTNYYIFVSSTTQYGQVAFTNPTGQITTFGVDSASSLTAGTYSNVLTGLTTSNVSASSGTLGDYTWNLLNSAGTNWKLVVTRWNNPVGSTASASSLGTSTAFTGGTVQVDTAGTYSTAITLDASSTNKIDTNGKAVTFSGVISDVSGAAGKLTFANGGTGGSITLTGANTYSGGTTIGGGVTVNVGNNAAFGTGAIATQPGSVIGFLSGSDFTLANNIVASGDPAFVTNAGQIVTYTGVISDGSSPGIVEVQGSGTLALTGVNTYTGSTLVSAGATLALQGVGSIATSSYLSNSGNVDLRGLNGNAAFRSFSQTSTGSLLTSMTSSSAKTLAVSGQATLAGGLSITAASGTYRSGSYNVLTAGGITGTFSTLSGNLSSFARLYSLTYTNTTVDLLIGPSPTNTLRAASANASNLRNTLARREAVMAGALDYDCATFDKYGVCLSFQARYSGSGDMSEGAGVLTGAYSVSPSLRIGGVIDYRVSASNPTGLKFGDEAPIFGVYAKYSEQPNGTGAQTKVAAAVNTGRVSVTRSVFDQTTEAGSGKASLNSYALVGELGWGFMLDSQMIATPYAGLRYTDASRGAYSEASVAGVVDYPLAYDNFHQRSTTGLLGLRLNGALVDRIGYQLGAGVEYDLARQANHYTGTSSVSGITSFDVNASVGSNRARANGSAGLYYQIDKTQRLTGSVGVRQAAYGSSTVSSVLVGYQAAF